MNNKVYYNQADKRWANHPYPSPSLPKATIKSGGCGATCSAMVVSYLKQIISPAEMGDIFLNEGIRVNGGTSDRAYTYIAEKYDLKVSKTMYIAKAVECLKRGGICVARLKAGSLFSTGGHFIVLANISDNNLIVYDPYLYNNKFKNGNRKCVKVNGVEAIVSIDNFKKYCDYTIWCYEPTEDIIKSKYENGQFVEINVPIKIAYENGNKIIADDGNTQFWVDKSTLNDGIIKARVQIAYADRQMYMVQCLKDQFWVKEENIVKEL